MRVEILAGLGREQQVWLKKIASKQEIMLG